MTTIKAEANQLLAARESAAKQLPQAALHRLLIRFPRALNPRLDLAPLHFVCRARLFDGYRQAGRWSRRVRREPATPELGNRHHGRFIERSGSDFHAVANVLGVGEGYEA